MQSYTIAEGFFSAVLCLRWESRAVVASSLPCFASILVEEVVVLRPSCFESRRVSKNPNDSWREAGHDTPAMGVSAFHNCQNMVCGDTAF